MSLAHRPLDELRDLYAKAGPYREPLYLPAGVKPTGKQEFFLRQHGLEVFYGGAGGGGKSTAGLMAALQYVDVPRYAAVIFRKTYSDLSLPGSLMDVARRWLDATDARWKEMEHTWHFPSGASVTFAHMESRNAHLRYKSAEFQYIFFDELTDFAEGQYRFLFSRLRRPETGYFGASQDGVTVGDVPLRMRSASNPGGPGHSWVKQRLVNRKTRRSGAVFIPARKEDNPHLDQDAYSASLAELPPDERARIEAGDWDAESMGGLFDRRWIRVIEEAPPALVTVRSWDTAASEPSETYPDPDYTVGMRVSKRLDGKGYVIEEVVRFRKGPGDVEDLIEETAREVDGWDVAIHLEQEPGSSGKIALSTIMARLDGFDVHADRPVRQQGRPCPPRCLTGAAGPVVRRRRAVADRTSGRAGELPYRPRRPG
jgi:hypothetical protein